MKQFRIFLGAAALVLVTAGVFAKSNKFSTSTIYAQDPSTLVFHVVSSSAAFTTLTITAPSGGVQASINPSTSTGSFNLFTDNAGGNKIALYTSGY